MRSAKYIVLLALLASCGQSASILGIAVSSTDDSTSETKGADGSTETRTETGTVTRSSDGSFTLSLDLDNAANFDCGGSSCTLSSAISFNEGTISVTGTNIYTDTAAEWQAGSMNGIAADGDSITLNATSNLAWLCDESWTPRWSEMVLCYSFEGTGNTVTNIRSPGTFDGTLMSNATRTATARAGSQAVSLNGSSSYVATGYGLDTSTDKALTVMAWVKAPPTFAKGTVIGADDAGPSRQFHLHIDDFGTGVATAFFNSGFEAFNTTSASTNLDDDNWHHIAVTLSDNSSNGTIKLYVDGRQEAENTLNGHDAVTVAPYKLYIGAANQSGTPADFLAGIIDDVAIWTIDLSAAEIARIYHRQNMAYSGVYTSPVYDVGSSADMTSLSLTAPLPFGGALPGGAGNESSATYRDLVNAAGETRRGSGLSSRLLALYHFDDDLSAGVLDYSGHQKNSTLINTSSTSSTTSGTIGTIETVSAGISAPEGETSFGSGLSAGEPGIIGRSLRFKGGVVRFPNPGETGAISVSVWIKPNNQFTPSDYTSLVSVGRDESWDLQYERFTNKLRLGFHDGSNWLATTTSSDIPQNQWTHVVAVYDSNLTSPHYKLYLNGLLDVSSSSYDNLTITTESATPLDVGAWGEDLGRSFQGQIDELAIWSRGLGPEEVLEIFRRGANQIKLQARICGDSACNTVISPWFGPAGWSNYFSWWYNRTSIDSTGIATGSVLLSQPNFLLSKFFYDPSPGRHWQFRTILESRIPTSECLTGSPTCYPVLASVGLHAPASQSSSSSSSFTNTPAIPYSTLTSIAIGDTGSCAYQFAPQGDGIYYYHDGSSWTLATTESQNNQSFDPALANISGWPTGSQLVIKAIVGGGGAPCTIQNIEINGT